MRVSNHSRIDFGRRLNTSGFAIPCGPFNVRIYSGIDHVADALHRLYSDFPECHPEDFIDFEIRIDPPSLLRRYLRPQVSLSCDGRQPFKPLPLAQAFPMLEWGLNWVLSSHAHEHLVIHAAVVEREGGALILAADPGSGKSTLCAALVDAGWRLISDELALVNLKTGQICPIARPISLKNRSIDVIRQLNSETVFSRVCRDTAKGDIAHVKPPTASVNALGHSATPKLVVFPKYSANVALDCSPVGKAHALAELTRHAFNAPLLGAEAFETIARLLDQTSVFRVEYSSFDHALPEIDRLWRLTA